MEVNKIYHGDCLEVLKEIEDNSIDAAVTDPPYALGFMGKEWDTFDKSQFEKRGNEGKKDLKVIKNFETLPRYNAKDSTNSFQEFTYQWAKEVYRVLKPGGHLLSFGGSRTYHRMAVAIEDAGFEIRDQIMWVYGSGFPKSLNIGKAIDKLLGNEREVIEKNPNDREKRENQLSGYGLQGGVGKAEITKGNTEWEGWGTALKPAHEPIVLARKPLTEKTVAENILKYRTGGLNIDGCRVETTENWVRLKGKNEGLGGEYLKGKKEIPRYSNNQGRFPSNFIHDGSEEVIKHFPNTKSTSGFKGCKTSENSHEGYKRASDKNWIDTERGFNDSGSAARFFYCAKASTNERNFGLDEFDEKNFGFSGGANSRLKAGETEYLQDHIGLNRIKKMRNHHPTIKPIALMRYLVRLVTPPAGTVLDPFTGSGTTGIAAKLEGFNFIGIEKEKEYIEIAEARIKAHKIEEEQLKLI